MPARPTAPIAPIAPTAPTAPISPGDISAVVLAGGRGQRMGGVDKGLQPYHGQPLALHALQRLRAQTLAPAQLLISANRHLADYRAWGVPVWPDDGAGAEPGFAGPLAGLLTALAHVHTPLLLCVPCDAPRFPLSLCERLAQALCAQQADLAVAQAPNTEAAGDPTLRTQPVFCLLRTTLRHSLQAHVAAGGRRVQAWAAAQRHTLVPFDQPGDDPLAFANANTLAQLQALQALAQTPAEPRTGAA